MNAPDKQEITGQDITGQNITAQNIIGIAGAGAMGAGIAQVAANCGHPVRLYDLDPDSIQKGIDAIRAGLQKLVARGRKSPEQAENLLSRIHACPALRQLSDCDLVIEAVTEDRHAKQQLFRQLEQICRPATLLASNTSSISITALGAGLSRPQNLAGMHFFNPAPVMKLVEIVSGLATSPDTAGCLFDTAANWGKIPVHVKSSPGFLVNRVARAFYAEPLRLLQEGAAGIATLDALFKASGFPMGPFELMDVIGNDVNYAVTESVFRGDYHDPRFRPSVLQKERVEAGFLGRKTGRGWYDYNNPAPEGSTVPHPSNPGKSHPEAATITGTPEVDTLTSDWRPRSIKVRGDLGTAAALIPAAEKAGITVTREDGNPAIFIGNTLLALTDGRTATLRANAHGTPDLILFDLMADYAETPHVAVAKAQQASADALHHAAGFFNALGKTVSVLDDTPGLCLMRTVCMLANEGADAVHQRICEVAAVDQAMQYGMNHPRGPLQWADQIGLAEVRSVLRNLQQSYGPERYRCSPLLDRKVEAGEVFYPEPAR